MMGECKTVLYEEHCVREQNKTEHNISGQKREQPHESQIVGCSCLFLDSISFYCFYSRCF